MTAYESFLSGKTQSAATTGMTADVVAPSLYPFQRALVNWALEKTRGAIFADCGLGKTAIQATWADNVARLTKGRVLIVTPLAVSQQTVDEGEKFGVGITRSVDGKAHAGVTVTNYEQLHKFSSSDFSGVVCDESSILKSFDGARRQVITDFMRKTQYRLLATATAAPNDFMELGTSSEALGYMGHMDMLNHFFKNDHNNSASGRMYGEAIKWRFKGHAERPFWRWVCSWARAIRKPSDMGFDDTAFVLPPLIEREHLVDCKTNADGMLFALPAGDLHEQRKERRRTVEERCARVADLTNGTGQPALVWCHLNDEGDLLERVIKDAVQVSGEDSDETKEDKFRAFSKGRARVLITKPKIGAWGLNFQHCAHVVTFPSHSYEQHYQGVRRCWRFGQTHPVVVDNVFTEGDRKVFANMMRKSEQAERMFTALVTEMNNELGIKRSNQFTTHQEVPSWL